VSAGEVVDVDSAMTGLATWARRKKPNSRHGMKKCLMGAINYFIIHVVEKT
jgi:hypothetical protein